MKHLCRIYVGNDIKPIYEKEYELGDKKSETEIIDKLHRIRDMYPTEPITKTDCTLDVERITFKARCDP